MLRCGWGRGGGAAGTRGVELLRKFGERAIRHRRRRMQGGRGGEVRAGVHP